MSNYIATVIKSGNSYALRVPKAYVEVGKLELGQKIELDAPRRVKRQDRAAFERAMRELQALEPFKGITDPVAWQREIRKGRPLPGRD